MSNCGHLFQHSYCCVLYMPLNIFLFKVFPTEPPVFFALTTHRMKHSFSCCSDIDEVKKLFLSSYSFMKNAKRRRYSFYSVKFYFRCNLCTDQLNFYSGLFCNFSHCCFMWKLIRFNMSSNRKPGIVLDVLMKKYLVIVNYVYSCCQ